MTLPILAPSNPLLGENTHCYKYRFGEKEKAVKKRGMSTFIMLAHLGLCECTHIIEFNYLYVWQHSPEVG